MLLLSFIIPLYNCGQWIEHCLESIYAVDIEENKYEVIVIDDGSKDNGPQIVEEYQSKHNNLIFIRQQNSGASAARNRGLDVARGMWIWFVDADDAIISNVLKDGSDIRKAMENVDTEMIVFNYRKYYAENHIDSISVVSDQKVMDGCDNLRHGNLYLWNRLFRRAVLKNVRFVEGTKNIEDFYFDICAILPMTKVVCLPIAGYSYNQQNMVSTSRNSSKENLKKLSDDTQTIYNHMLEDLKSLSGRQRDVFLNLLWESVAGYLFSLFTFYDSGDVKSGIAFLRQKNLYPANKSANKKANLFLLLANHEQLLLITQKISRFLGIKK